MTCDCISSSFYLLHVSQTLFLPNWLVFDFCSLLRFGLCRLALRLGMAFWLGGAVWLGVVWPPPPLTAMFTFWLTSRLRCRVVGFLRGWVTTGKNEYIRPFDSLLPVCALWSNNIAEGAWVDVEISRKSSVGTLSGIHKQSAKKNYIMGHTPHSGNNLITALFSVRNTNPYTH